jgi:hypothetical protein
MNNIQPVKYREIILETLWDMKKQSVFFQSFVSGCKRPIKERKINKRKEENYLKGFGEVFSFIIYLYGNKATLLYQVRVCRLIFKQVKILIF